ncbi:TetR family transcriptional regulator [Streptomyces albus]|uniref:TetR family transcriptional regulator n=1 Tax=Streptomyces albus (strain ATCC 21838 / DSM 41398 / FERM P-419 / JCM 4703 / NBRC 107858) TaxID=1081613 RepID=A0A0B5EW13_STRA4|nr:TetR family transcriptional regulator [Streptomyces albus]AOU77167.1 TetR family transcriptional regulator [Streptomyces albus]AYN32945.1 TetR/AcrR family transcriptional regulator [Streptomyces albus]
MSSRPYHHGNLRAALLEHAERTLREEGAQALTLRGLAREAGVSHGAPRRHFPDRQALLDALAVAGFERLRVQLEAAAGSGGGASAQLRALAQTYMDFATTHPALLELMFTGKHRPGAEAVYAAAERALGVPLAVITALQAEGELAPGDSARLGRVAFAAFHGLATLAGGGMLPPQELREAVGDTVETLLVGMRKR